MDLKEAMYTRRAVREFTAEPVEKIQSASSSTPPSRRRAQSINNRGILRGSRQGAARSNMRDAKAHMLRTSQ